MKRIIGVHCTVIFAAMMVALSSGCGIALFDDAGSNFEIVGSGASVGGDGWLVSSGHMFLKKNEPTVIFGMYETPNGERGISFLWIFRHADVKEFGDDSDHASLSFDGEVASTTGGITVNGNGVDFEIEFQTDDETGTLQATKFTIDGKDIDASKGLLFLMDLTSDSGTYEQVNAKFPSGLPNPESPENVEKIARQITKQLKNENDRVREFLAE